MEHLPPNTPDEEPRGPDDERLWPGEIDLTGVVRQDDALADVIGDAIGEAEYAGGEVPEWGARTLARALANEREDPLSGALHQFAVTGQAEPEAVTQELAELYQATDDDQLREWVNWLGTYMVQLQNDGRGDTSEAQPQPTDLEVPIDGTPLEQVSAYLRIAFAEADSRQEAISRLDAQTVAALLATLLPAGSEMERFAETGKAHRARLLQECEDLAGRSWQIHDVPTWLTRFQHHLASRDDLGKQPPP